jgi:creatinase
VEQIRRLPNGSKAKPTFSAAEMARRLLLRAHMADQAIDAALLTSYHNINYYGDFLYCAFGRPYGLVVSQDATTLISANIDGGQPWRRSAGDNLNYTDWQRDNYCRAIQSLIPQHGRVGG